MSSDTAIEAPALGPRLLDPACYPHQVDQPRLVETHISWVLLTGRFAYKVKKPVRLPFLDFSDAAARRRFCEEELRVNRRLAPDLYLDVVPITGDLRAPRIEGRGEPFDHAVKMVQFDESGRLDRVLDRGELDAARMREAGRMVARFHARAGAAEPDTPFASVAQVREESLANLDALDAAPDADRALLERLRAWSVETLDALAPVFAARRAGGRVRECHGDLHLANMTLVDDRVLAFDALEFDERLRWIDVMSEIAFTMMDLLRRGRPDLAYGFLDAWLEVSGDHAGLVVLRHYLVYRALVRAKIAAIDAAGGAGASASEALAALTGLAARIAFEAPAPMLVATHGVSGSGKSHLAGRLLGPLGAVRLRSDVERARLFPGPEGRYGADAGERTYRWLAERAGEAIDAGWPVVVDATCLERRWRALLRETARARGVPYVLLACDAPVEVLHARVAGRAREGTDPSEATVAILQRQRAGVTPLPEAERRAAVEVDTGAPTDPAAVARQLLERARRVPREG